MALIGKITIMVIIAFGLVGVEYFLDSNYLRSFFAQNAILLAGAIFTIHAASVGILIGQLGILSIAKFKFPNTIKSIKKSVIEAFISLVAIGATAIILDGDAKNNEISKMLLEYWPMVSGVQLFAVIYLFAIVADSIYAIIMCFDAIGAPLEK